MTHGTDAATGGTGRFGLDGTTVEAAAVHVRGGAAESDGDDLQDIFARAAWTTIAEPGDGAAGLVVAALGAGPALDALIAETSASTLAARVDPARTADRAALEAELADAQARWRPRLRSAEVLHALEAAERTGTRLIVPDDGCWPVGVDDLGLHAPIGLWVRGRRDAVEALGRSVALVGARACTEYGQLVAADSAAGIARAGYAVVSGAAYGIDGWAHRAALQAGGTTVAFLAGGVDRFYPSGHDGLLGRIVATGAVISELPPGAQPTKWRFLQRNRLIAASSLATVVLEAGWRSGSLNTAGHAAALGRPLGAVPGPVTSVASAGCHRLIRDWGATCVTSVDEMLELVGENSAAAPRAAGPSGDEVRVLDAISARAPRSVEEIARRSGQSAATVIGLLAGLQLDGRVRESGGRWLATRS